MTSEKLKHLEMIQSTITRLNSNSFAIKGWAVTVISALYALAATGANPKLIWITFLPCISFWVLDAHFLYFEKQFRARYEVVASSGSDTSDMDMSPEHITDTVPKIMFSKTFIPFYGVLVLLNIIIAVILFNS